MARTSHLCASFDLKDRDSDVADGAEASGEGERGGESVRASRDGLVDVELEDVDGGRVAALR